MKIAVCMKQVPRLDEVKFDKTNRIVREDVELMTNPSDLQALGHALELGDGGEGEVIAVTMGPPSAAGMLADAMHRGADRAVHLVDKRFGGADTLATARALAQALEPEAPDIVIFGRMTLDGATAQVGPQVAELLGIPQVTHASEIEVTGDDSLAIKRETERGSEQWTVATPVVITVERGPDPPEPDEAGEAQVDELTAEDLGGSPREYGTRGSPTFVKQVRELSSKREVERVDGVEEGSRRVLDLRCEGKSEDPHDAGADDSEHARAIWVLAHRDGERVHPTTLEGLACAGDAAAELDAEVVAVLLCAEAGDLLEELGAHGADRVLTVRHPVLAEYRTAPFTSALAAAIEEHEPYAVIAPWSSEGRDYVPRVAARLGLGLTGDFVRLEVDADEDGEEEPDLLWIKPAWAGTVESPIITHRSPSIGTLRPGVWRALELRERDEIPSDVFEPDIDEAGAAPECTDRQDELENEMLLDNAPVVVCVGADLDQDGVDRAQQLAEALSGALGATTAAVSAGLAPAQVEIGVLKRSMSPRLAIAIGVGDENDLDALRGARRLVTVHPQSDAAVHERADLAIVAETGEFITAVLERVERDR